MTNAFLRSPLWGDLFTDPDLAAHFTAEAFLKRMLAFEAAWTGAMPEDDARAAAASAIAGFAPDWQAMARGAAVDGVPVPEMVRQLRDAAPEAGAALHKGATSQDVIDTAMVLTLRDALSAMHARLDPLLDRLEALDRTEGEAALMGRTRMQAALPITVAQRVRSWRGPLTLERDALVTAQERLSVVQIGGPVGAREVGEDFARAVAERLDLRLGPVWHTDRRLMVDTGHRLTTLAGVLGKMGMDVTLMAQQGIDAARLTGGGSSSAMPHKQNPVLAETLVTLAHYVAGQQATLAQALVHEQERSGMAWALEWLTLPAMAEATAAALRHATALAGRIAALGDGAQD